MLLHHAGFLNDETGMEERIKMMEGSWFMIYNLSPLFALGY